MMMIIILNDDDDDHTMIEGGDATYGTGLVARRAVYLDNRILHLNLAVLCRDYRGTMPI